MNRFSKLTKRAFFNIAVFCVFVPSVATGSDQCCNILTLKCCKHNGEAPQSCKELDNSLCVGSDFCDIDDIKDGLVNCKSDKENSDTE